MDLSAYARGLDKAARLRYLEKVCLCGGVDPLELEDAELQRDVEVLPRVEFTDIKDYLVHTTSFVSREQLKAYKSMDGHNYLTSGWVQQPGVKVLPDSTIVVVGKVSRLPSSTCNRVHCAVRALLLPCQRRVKHVNTVTGCQGREGLQLLPVAVSEWFSHFNNR